MRNSKRILSAFLAFAVILSSLMALPVFAEEADTTTATEETAASGTNFPDVTDKDTFATAVKTLNKLGIITGYEDGTFGPYNNITRAEFAAMLLRMLGLGQTPAPLVAPFPDVDTAYWAVGVIEAAKNLGIITGYEDGTFKPNNNVSFEESLTMIVRAIGYENFGEATEIWYSKYLDAANRLGITKNAVGAVGTLATRSCVGQLVFNTLSVDAVENNTIVQTKVMEKYLGIKKAEGIIASNGITSMIYPDVNIRDNEVLIIDKETKKEDTFRVEKIEDYRDMIGASVTYYYKDGGIADYKDVILFDVKAATKTETIPSNLIDDRNCNSLTFAYYKTENAGKSSKITLSSNNVVIYNGKLYGAKAADSKFTTDMLPELGQVKLVNTDGDNTYDVIFIDNYKAYVVSTITTSKYEIKDSLSGANDGSVILDVDSDSDMVKIVDEKGNEKSFSDIKKNQSICVKESTGNGGTKLITAVIIGSAVTGKVTSASSKKVTVGSKSYGYSPVAQWVTDSEKPAPDKGGSYAFYLDINGDIFAYDKDESAEAKVQYGYIVKYGKRSGGAALNDNNPTYLKILTQSGSKTDIALHKTTKLDGNIMDDSTAIAYLEDTAEDQAKGYDGGDDKGARQLIKYTTKTAGGETVFDEIFTTNSVSEDDDEELRWYNWGVADESDYTIPTVEYYSDGYFAVTENASAKVYKGSAIMFVVPDEMTKWEEYGTVKGSIVTDKSYKMEAFDMSSGTAKVIVFYGEDNTTRVNATTSLFRFDRTEQNTNEETNDAMMQVFGYENGSTTEISYWVSPSSADTIEDLKEGAIVRFGTDSEGYVTLAAEDILFNADGADTFFYKAEHESNSYKDEDGNYIEDKCRKYASADMKLIYGSLYDTGEYVIVIPDEEDNLDSYDVTDTTEVLRLANSKFGSSVNFFEYDLTDADKIEITTLEGYKITDLASYVVNDSGAKVLIQLKDGNVKSVTVIVD